MDTSSLALLEIIVIAGCLGSLAFGRSLHVFQHLLGFRGVFALFTDTSSVLVKDEGEGHADQSEQSGDRRAPMNAVLASNRIHVWREQGESKAEEGPNDTVGGQDRCCVDKIRVGEVVHGRKEDENHAETEGSTTNDRNDPVNAGAISSSKDGETDDDGDGTDHSRRQTCLGRSDTTVLVSNATVSAILVEDDVCKGDEHADQDTKEGKATDAWAPSSTLLEDDGEGTKKRVKHSIDDSNVNGKQSDDGLVDKEEPRTTESNLELGLESGVTALVELADVALSSDLCELLCTPSKKNRSVGLRHGDGADNSDDAGKDGEEADDPLPASAFAEETTSDRAKSRTEERSAGKDGHGETTLLCVEHVGKSTTSVDEWTRAKETCEETEDNEGSDVGRCNGNTLPEGEDQVGDDKEVATTDDFREWCPEERSKGKT